MLSLRVLFVAGILVMGCDTEVRDAPGTRPQVDTEATLGKIELAKRKAYTSAAMTQATAISWLAGEHDLCKELGDGTVGPTPALDRDCNSASDGSCVGVEDPSRSWEYPNEAWTDEAWILLGYRYEAPTRYHFQLSWTTREDGTCDERVTILGDLDADGIYATYERASDSPGPEEWGGELLRVTNALE